MYCSALLGQCERQATLALCGVLGTWDSQYAINDIQTMHTQVVRALLRREWGKNQLVVIECCLLMNILMKGRDWYSILVLQQLPMEGQEHIEQRSTHSMQPCLLC